ncbi:twin-arginine translocase subunit TatC [Microlunatus soli]|uniref:Sec-independent protein translocase protein TatC n=1 Tax=Microlunatus soli TaxID=630515 RepID=A0A1H1Y123_9ACTN|nr:twin-arginine translocase subunit TatC [Microlunatus soli]SDT15100.1 sec-independent protein translocase protein TatC [Microlunatus soli]
MTLFEHLRELRYRLVIIVLAIAVGLIVAFIFNAQLFDLIMHPFKIAQAVVQEQHPDIKLQTIVEGVGSSFTLVLKTCLIAAIIGTSPIWIYQIWAFIVPGLMAKEKKWTLIFLSAAIPLFLFGVALAYFVIPKGIAVMIGFNPDAGTITNLLDVQGFLTFLIRVMIVFGAGFELPVFVLGLNFLGVVKAKQLSKARPFIIFACFVFGAVATPQTDPISMLMLAAPMTILYIAAEIIAHIHDRALARRGVDGGVDANSGIANDRALAALEGRDLDATEPSTQQTVADLLGLGPATTKPDDASGPAKDDDRS